jgi:hypothetical protein
MNLSSSDLSQLRDAFAICRVAGIDAVVVTDNMIRGITTTSKFAILSPINLSIPAKIKIGIGRIGELEKRLSVFADAVSAELKLNDNDEVTLMTLRSGKSSIQFRCTSERLIKYPKQNDDEPAVTIEATKAEVSQVARAVKTLGAETVTVSVSRAGVVKFECSAPTNESFIEELSRPATFENDVFGVVHTFEGDRFASILDFAARESSDVPIVIGVDGSLTLSVKGHVVVVIPNSNGSDGDDDE